MRTIPAAGLDHLHTALDSGSDPRQFARQVVDYLRNLLLVRMSSADQGDATTELRAQMARHAQQFETSDLLSLVRVFNQAANVARAAWQPSLPLELAFIEALGLGKEWQAQVRVQFRNGYRPSSCPSNRLIWEVVTTCLLASSIGQVSTSLFHG